MSDNRRRVVVTGLGVISPLGINTSGVWDKLVKGQSGVTPIGKEYVGDLPIHYGGVIPPFDIEPYSTEETKKYLKRFHLTHRYSAAAAHQAMMDSGLNQSSCFNPTRVGCIIGSGIGANDVFMEANVSLAEGKLRASPFMIPNGIINMSAGIVSIQFNLKGPSFAPVSACATGGHSIATAVRLIQQGDADAMLVGSTEAAVKPTTIAGFHAMRALSTRDCSSEEASCPWDERRDGFIFSTGAGVLVIEELEKAKARGANIYAEIAGVGMNSDAFHISNPCYESASDCMQLALQDASENPDSIDYINAHATSTVVGDISETKAIKKVFGEKTSPWISSTKSMSGHLLGAAGAFEAIVSCLVLRHKIAPPTINLHNPAEGCDLDYVPNTARAFEPTHVLSNSFGFGGANATLIFRTV